MADINIFIIENGSETRKQLKKLLPPTLQKSLEGHEVEMESGEQLRDKLPEGFPRAFIVPEEVLVFPSEEDEPAVRKTRRRQMKDINLKNKRKKIAGNAE
jgi:hypothetical protein